MVNKKLWYYVKNGQRERVDFDDLVKLLKEGSIPSNTLVWTKGWGAWVKADECKEFEGIFDAPPAMPDFNNDEEDEPPKITKEPTYSYAKSNTQLNIEPIDNRRLYCILSYVGVLWLVPLLTADKDDSELKFHINQGMILSILTIIGSIVIPIIISILGAVLRTEQQVYGISTGVWIAHPIVGVISSLLWLALWGIVIALSVIGILNVRKGQLKYLPIIGTISIYK